MAFSYPTLHKKKSRAKRSASTSAVPSGGPCNKWLRPCGQEDPGVHEDDVFFDDIIQGDLGLNFGGSAADDKDVTQTDGHSRDTRYTLHKKKSRAKRSASTSAVPSGGPCNKWLRPCGQEDPGVHEDDVFFDDIIQGDLGLNFGGSAADDKDVTQTDVPSGGPCNKWLRPCGQEDPGVHEDDVFFDDIIQGDLGLNFGGSAADDKDVTQTDGHSRDTRLSSWKREPRRHETTEIGLNRIWDRILDRTLDNSDRRQFGMGVVGRFFGRSYKRSVLSQEPIKEQLDHIEDHRPFFTYWITTVQIIILCLSIFAYGLGPFGFNLAHNSGL
ncbi:uncharacterized protein LOC113468312, partial [Diaphorina citri]|uniref:Uncharacterized protein LOC113468312 n=1 Tax=Diaphorina citri TaxID=121845 RepID=A0A3Q0J2H1_DIACI